MYRPADVHNSPTVLKFPFPAGPTCGNDSVVNLGRRVTAALILFGWLYAIGHIGIEHGVVTQSGWSHGAVDHCCDAHHHHGHHGPEHGHEHDLTGLAAGASTNPVGQPALFPFFAVLTVAWMADELAPHVEVKVSHGPTGESPPDERSFGWLFDCHTALTVRGPSLIG